MFRLTNALAIALYLVVTSMPAGHQAPPSTPAPLVADGGEPMPPPYPLAIPGKRIFPG